MLRRAIKIGLVFFAITLAAIAISALIGGPTSLPFDYAGFD